MWTAFPESETGLLYAIARDTTELIEVNQRLQLAIDESPAALIMVDQRGVIQLVNRETERLFGYSRDLLIGKAIEMLVPANSHAQHQWDRAAFFQNPGTRSMGAGRHLRAVRRDGIVFPVEIGLNPVQLGDEVYVLSTVIDLTLQKQAEERMTQLAKELEEANARLAELAVTDPLTNVLNRRAFDEQLDKEIQLMSRMGRAISLLMIDIDHFKQHNDQYGHPAGDKVLKIVARLLGQNARTTDVVARYGGEEFAVIMPDSNEEGAVQMAERFRTAIHSHPWGPAKLTVSMGISTLLLRNEVDRVKANFGAKLLAEADRALYLSKHNGRDQVTHVSEIPGPDQGT
jgi:diguanylate cyclase (GGDEF)-like protein/PAS domain S-box-containing protein